MIKGSIVALVTPMFADGEIDYQSLEKLIEFHISAGTQGIVPVGTTGESPTVNNREHLEMMRQTVKMVNGRIPVIAGTGSNSTSEAITQSLAAKEFGADACLSVVPYYNKPTQKGLFLHYEAIAKAVDLPIILYNVPHRTVADISNDVVVKLSEIDNITGIKDATGDIERGKDLIARCPADFAIYSGDDMTGHELCLAGGHGIISVTANVVPAKMQQMILKCLDKDEAGVSEINATLMKLHEAMGCQSNPIPVKWALEKMGLIKSGIRLPLHPLDEALHEQVLQALQLNDIETKQR